MIPPEHQLRAEERAAFCIALAVIAALGGLLLGRLVWMVLAG